MLGCIYCADCGGLKSGQALIPEQGAGKDVPCAEGNARKILSPQSVVEDDVKAFWLQDFGALPLAMIQISLRGEFRSYDVASLYWTLSVSTVFC